MKYILSDKKYLLLIMCFIYLAFSRAYAAESDLNKQLELMQKKIESLESAVAFSSSKTLSQRGKFETFASETLAIGGYLENSITSIWGPDTPSETVTDRHKLGINLTAELANRFRMVSQFSVGFNFPLRNEHNNPSHGSSFLPTNRSFGSLSFGSLLSQAYGEYNFGNSLKFQFGMGYVPFGRSFQVREPVLFLRYQGPQLIRVASTTQIIVADPFWKGLRLEGLLTDDSGFDLYTMSSLDHAGKIGGGLRFWYNIIEDLTLGISGQSGQRGGSAYLAYGVDLSWQISNFGLNAEYVVNDSGLGVVTSYYIQPYIKLLDRKLTIHLDADYMKNVLGLTTLGTASVADPYIKWEYGVGVNYQLLANVKVRLGFLLHDYVGTSASISGQNRDFYSIANSWGISF